jgi:hypothetical protein
VITGLFPSLMDFPNLCFESFRDNHALETLPHLRDGVDAGFVRFESDAPSSIEGTVGVERQ